MAINKSRRVDITFTNEEGLSKKITVIQDVPDIIPIEMEQEYVPIENVPIEDPQPLPNPEDIFLDNPITLPIKPIDLSDIKFDFSDIDFGLGGLGTTPIGPIFAPGGGGTVQGWNNGDPRNNWGMGATSVGGTVPVKPPKISSGKSANVVIPPAPPEPVTPNEIKLPKGKQPTRGLFLGR